MKHHEFKKFDIAHFSPSELHILDEMQGGEHRLGHMRHFAPLEKILHDPKIKSILLKHYEAHAKGGRIGDMLREADKMKRKGRFGDTEIALVGPKTIEIFNHIMHGGSKNPHTGKHEFFNLGGFLGGVGKTIGRGVKAVGKYAGPVAGALGKALPGAVAGFTTGGPLGALAGGVGSLAMGSPSKMPNSMGKAAKALQQSPMGQQFMNSPYGQQAQNLYNQGKQAYGQGMNAYKQGKDLYNQFKNVAQTPEAQQMMQHPWAQQAMNSSYGQQAQQAFDKGNKLYNRAQNTYNNVQKEAQNAYGSAQNAYGNFQNAYNNMQQPQGQPQNQMQGQPQGYEDYQI